MCGPRAQPSTLVASSPCRSACRSSRRFRGVELARGPAALRARRAGPSGHPSRSTTTGRPPAGWPRQSRPAGAAGPSRFARRSRSTSIVPAIAAEDVAGYVTDAAARTGATTYKVKVGGPGSALADDLARVATVRAALSEAGVRDPLLRLDANGGWTVTEARRAARMFARRVRLGAGLLRAALPDDHRAGRAALPARRRRGVRADRGGRGPAPRAGPVRRRPRRSLRTAGDVLVVKVAPVGGVARALSLVEEIGLPVVVSGEMNTSVGLGAGIALAAAVPELAGACGLGTGLLLADDVCAGTLIPRDGELAVTRRLPDEPALGRAADALGAEDALWWRERLARCARLLSVV